MLSASIHWLNLFLEKLPSIAFFRFKNESILGLLLLLILITRKSGEPSPTLLMLKMKTDRATRTTAMLSQILFTALVLAGASNALSPPSHLGRAAANLQTSLRKSSVVIHCNVLGPHSNTASRSSELDPSQVQPNLAKNGQQTPEAGQVPSLTRYVSRRIRSFIPQAQQAFWFNSDDNFINFCETQNTVLTNGLQTKTGSCNPTIVCLTSTLTRRFGHFART